MSLAHPRGGKGKEGEGDEDAKSVARTAGASSREREAEQRVGRRGWGRKDRQEAWKSAGEQKIITALAEACRQSRMGPCGCRSRGQLRTHLASRDLPSLAAFRLRPIQACNWLLSTRTAAGAADGEIVGQT